MDRIVQKSLLFDFYGELLTSHQKEIYTEYIQEDVSVSEIAALFGISRQGAHDMIRRCEKQLNSYESKLHLVDHYLKIKGMVVKIRQCAQEIGDLSDPGMVREKMDQINRLTADILEEY